MSKVRLWKLGYLNKENPSQSILPTMKAINRLRDILASNDGHEDLELVWGPELDVQEFESLDVINLIETEDGKYERVLW